MHLKQSLYRVNDGILVDSIKCWLHDATANITKT